MFKGNATKCMTGEVRLSYPYLDEPYQMIVNGVPQGDPKYKVTLLIPKTDTATKADLDAAFKAAADAGLSKKFGGFMPTLKPRVHDGDGVREDGRPYGPECKGMWVLSASSKNKPQCVKIVGGAIVPCENGDLYSGCWARVTVNFAAFNTSSKGVGCYLGNILKVRDDVSLGGGASAESDFADFADFASASDFVNPITGEA